MEELIEIQLHLVKVTEIANNNLSKTCLNEFKLKNYQQHQSVIH